MADEGEAEEVETDDELKAMGETSNWAIDGAHLPSSFHAAALQVAFARGTHISRTRHSLQVRRRSTLTTG